GGHGHLHARAGALQRQRADHVVGLHARHAQDRDAQRLHQFHHRLDLRTQVVGHRRARGLVLGVHVVAEGLARRVDDEGDVLGLLLQVRAQHVGHAEQRAGGLAGGVGQRRQRVEGAVEVGGAVDQDQSCHGAILRGRRWHNGRPPRRATARPRPRPQMLRWFETRLDPFPTDPPAQPPASLYAFCRHYTRGAEPWLALLAATTGLTALAEVALYAYVGTLVDRMNALGVADFLAIEGTRLAWMAALVLLGLPLLVLLNSLVQHQTLLGNFPMRIRWKVHRYLLRQSMGYFQDEFAGRIATKLMQTSLAVRETVIKLVDIGNYVLVYFGATLVVAASADWRLMLPFAGWLLGYALLMRWFVPRMGRVSQEQADARSTMTGRIVDSYTNIATVKLFSHSRREQAYAREAMDGFLDTAYRQMR